MRIRLFALPFLIATLLTPTIAFAEEAVGWITSYEEAVEEARRTGKPIFLEFRCGP